MTAAVRRPKRRGAPFRRHEHTVLVLQGGGALGAYQAGVYEGMVEHGYVPDWVSGVSIGAINAALIAGNPPERRVERLSQFWDLVSSGAPLIPPASFDVVRPTLNWLSAASAATFGVPGMYAPRIPPAFLAPDGSAEALSIYDTSPLKSTLQELVDFDLINRAPVRLSLGAVKVRAGNSVYFDNRQTTIGPEHVMASAALPPGFPPIVIDGEGYWDGALVSNTPLWYVLDDSPCIDALIMQVDLFSAEGEMPRNLEQVLERAKDIQYSSKTRFNTNRVKELDQMRAALLRVLRKLPPELASDADVRRLNELSECRKITIAHLINRRYAHSAHSKDFEFSRATAHELWASGLADVRLTCAHPELLKGTEFGEGVRVYDLTR